MSSIFVVHNIDDDSIYANELGVNHLFAINGRLHRFRVMLDPAANQSKTILCTKPEIRNADAPF